MSNKINDNKENVSNLMTFFPEVIKARKIKSKKEVVTKKKPSIIREQLIKQWEYKKKNPVVKVRPESERIRQLREELSHISTVRKERVFDSEPTEEEKLIIQKRVALQQLQYKEYEKRDFFRKIDKIMDMYDFINEDEIQMALDECENDENQVILNFTQQEYLPKIRKLIAMKYDNNNQTQIKIQMSNEQIIEYKKMVKKRKTVLKKTTSEDAKTRYTSYSRLSLDDALNQLKSQDPEKAFEGWSEARIRAYKMINTKPNTYYYRFNAPGEKQRNGAWTPEEKKRFMKRLAEVGADGQWGIFSMTIPGRVGYQCSNFYRHLLKSKQIIDPNYVVEDNGKMHYLFGKKFGQVGQIRTHSRHVKKPDDGASSSSTNNTNTNSNANANTNTSTNTTKRKRGPKKSRKYDDDDISDDDYYYEKKSKHDDDDSGNYRGTGRRITRSSRVKQLKEENPLPGFTDPITLEEVLKPAISPYGHVMGYDSWVRCLNNAECRNICPITKKPLTKRELVILTYENIDLYRDKIINK